MDAVHAGLQIAARAPIFGLGLGNFGVGAADTDWAFSRSIGVIAGAWAVEPHNLYIYLLTSAGLVGLIPYLLLSVKHRLARAAWLAARRELAGRRPGPLGGAARDAGRLRGLRVHLRRDLCATRQHASVPGGGRGLGAAGDLARGGAGMKVALLGPHPVALAPGGAPLPGGVDAVVAVLAPALAARNDVDLAVVTAVAGLSAADPPAGNGYTVYAVPRPRGGRLTGQRAVQAHLRAQLAALAPDIVHAHSAGIYAGAALGCGRSDGHHPPRHHLTARCSRRGPDSAWSARLRMLADARFERSVIRRAREIIAISPYVLDVFRHRTHARFHLVENPVDGRFFTVTDPPPGRDRLLSVGRVIPRKGILALIEAFAQVARTRPDATLVIAGETETDPVYVERCRAACRGIGAGRSCAIHGRA